MGKSAREQKEAIASVRPIDENEDYGLSKPKTLDPYKAQEMGLGWGRENALESRKLQAEMDPYVAKTRALLQEQVYKNLELGERMTPEMQRAIVGTALSNAGSAGIGFGSGAARGLTGASVGWKMNELGQQRRAEASGLLAANPEPQIGIDPGELVGLNVRNLDTRNAYNQQLAGIRAQNAGYNRQLQQWQAALKIQNAQARQKRLAAIGSTAGMVLGTAVGGPVGGTVGSLAGGFAGGALA